MIEPVKIFLTKGQILDLAYIIEEDKEDLGDNYIFEIQQIDDVDLGTITKCLSSRCDNYNLIWNDFHNWWERLSEN